LSLAFSVSNAVITINKQDAIIKAAPATPALDTEYPLGMQ